MSDDQAGQTDHHRKHYPVCACFGGHIEPSLLLESCEEYITVRFQRLFKAHDQDDQALVDAVSSAYRAHHHIHYAHYRSEQAGNDPVCVILSERGFLSDISYLILPDPVLSEIIHQAGHCISDRKHSGIIKAVCPVDHHEHYHRLYRDKQTLDHVPGVAFSFLVAGIQERLFQKIEHMLYTVKAPCTQCLSGILCMVHSASHRF